MCSAPWYAASSVPRIARSAGATASAPESPSCTTAPAARPTDGSRGDGASEHRREHPRPLERKSRLGQRFPHRRQEREDLRRSRPARGRAGCRHPQRRSASGAEASFRAVLQPDRARPGCGPCTRTPFGSAIPPSRIFSSELTVRVYARAGRPGDRGPQGEPIAARRARGSGCRARDRRLRSARQRSGSGGQRPPSPSRAWEEAVGDGAEGFAHAVAVGEA